MTFSPRRIAPTLAMPPCLVMPDQNLRAAFRDPLAPGLRRAKGIQTLRAAVLLLPLAVSVALGWLFLAWFQLDGHRTVAGTALGVGSGFALYWPALSACSAALGLFWRAPPQSAPTPRALRVAVLLPMYGEPAEATIGNAVCLLAAVAGTAKHSFALHILSDTHCATKTAREEAAVAKARRAHPHLAITHRRRARNTNYKSGNIRDWVQLSGDAYDAMLVLDADSIVGPRTVVGLADAMAREPGIGLIQTTPRVLPGTTVWQGLQSFASQVYGANMGRGFAMWAGDEGNYLGHNALVRLGAFAASAGLPHLPGPAPRGGVILSHDFVEAALLRRAGWGVRMMPEAADSSGDSFEDTPETLAGHIKRDRRWCQGNLQHLRLLAVPGLHPLSRFHLLQGAMAYLASAWWLALLVLWVMTASQGPLPDNPVEAALPTSSPDTTGSPLLLAASVGLMLLTPKILGVVGYLRDRPLALREVPRFAGMVMAEILVSALLAPAMMVQQLRALWRMAAGIDGGWAPHCAGRMGLPALVRFHWAETGLGLGCLTLSLAGYLTPWLYPLTACLCATVPLAAVMQMPRTARNRKTRTT